VAHWTGSVPPSRTRCSQDFSLKNTRPWTIYGPVHRTTLFNSYLSNQRLHDVIERSGAGPVWQLPNQIPGQGLHDVVRCPRRVQNFSNFNKEGATAPRLRKAIRGTSAPSTSTQAYEEHTNTLWPRPLVIWERFEHQCWVVLVWSCTHTLVFASFVCVAALCFCVCSFSLSYSMYWLWSSCNVVRDSDLSRFLTNEIAI
jgi:hypothetical protein